jgi:hypothetical protein
VRTRSPMPTDSSRQEHTNFDKQVDFDERTKKLKTRGFLDPVLSSSKPVKLVSSLHRFGKVRFFFSTISDQKVSFLYRISFHHDHQAPHGRVEVSICPLSGQRPLAVRRSAKRPPIVPLPRTTNSQKPAFPSNASDPRGGPTLLTACNKWTVRVTQLLSRLPCCSLLFLLRPTQRNDRKPRRVEGNRPHRPGTLHIHANRKSA